MDVDWSNRWFGILMALVATFVRSVRGAEKPPSDPGRIQGELPFNNPPWTGDFDGMVKRRYIRVLVVYSKTLYAVDQDKQYGTSYELLKAFETHVNKQLKTKHLKVHVVFVPTARDDLILALLEGRGDIAAAALTITPERGKQVDFSTPLVRNINEITVTGPQSPALATKELRLHPDIAVNTGGEFAWMFRQHSPQLKAIVDAFATTHGQGTTFGNILLKRYALNPKFVKQATSPEEIKKFPNTVGLFRTYGDKYAMDYLLMMAQGYQESRLDHQARSPVGAIGVMQIMPATGKDLQVGDITQLESNIHGGVKYIRHMVDQFFDKEPMDRLNKGLFAFAAYNAGPGRIQKLRREAARRGLDPNKWFNNVETVAAEKIGAETVTYVSNIYKYYIGLQISRRAGRRAPPGPCQAPKGGRAIEHGRVYKGTPAKMLWRVAPQTMSQTCWPSQSERD